MEINLKKNLLNDLRHYKNEILARYHAKYFQAHKGGYGQGDSFWGIKVPRQRVIARKYCENINLKEVEELLFL